MPNSWKVSLHRILNQRADSRLAIVGIGNTLRSDDAAGILAARRLMASRVLRDLESVTVMDAGHAPENSTAELRRFAPEIVLLIDAADMDEPPGTIRLVEMDEIEGLSASTHSLPLSMLARYLNWELKCEVILLGIQPASIEVGETVSDAVLHAVDLVASAVQDLVGQRKEAVVI